jgi:fermentation-respiration switch protein FrsA (DUF1100 family)
MAAVMAGDRFDSIARVRRLSVPIFVAHGDRDEIVPFALGERLFDAAGPPRRFPRRGRTPQRRLRRARPARRHRHLRARGDGRRRSTLVDRPLTLSPGRP